METNKFLNILWSILIFPFKVMMGIVFIIYIIRRIKRYNKELDFTIKLDDDDIDDLNTNVL